MHFRLCAPAGQYDSPHVCVQQRFCTQSFTIVCFVMQACSIDTMLPIISWHSDAIMHASSVRGLVLCMTIVCMYTQSLGDGVQLLRDNIAGSFLTERPEQVQIDRSSLRSVALLT